MNRANFTKLFKEVLLGFGFGEESIDIFMTPGSKNTIRDLDKPVCNSISIEIDNKMLDLYPDYQGFLNSETFDQILAINTNE